MEKNGNGRGEKEEETGYENETNTGEENKKKKGGARCHSKKVRRAGRRETFERGKKPYASAAAIRRRRIAMLRSLALSLAASTAAQFLHANQPTDPPSTHRLTNHPTPPLCHLVHPQSPHTPVSLPLTASDASPSSLWTATFAHVPSPPLSFPPSPTTPTQSLLFSFSFFLFHGQSPARSILGVAHFFSFGSSSLLSYLYYALFTDGHPSIRMFLLPFSFLLFLSCREDFSFATK